MPFIDICAHLLSFTPSQDLLLLWHTGLVLGDKIFSGSPQLDHLYETLCNQLRWIMQHPVYQWAFEVVTC